MEAPNEVIKAWLAAQPREVITDVVALVGAMATEKGDLALSNNIAEMTENFYQWLSSSDFTFRQIGITLTFKACFEYLLSNRSTEEDWEKTKQVLATVAERFPSGRDSFDKLIADIPERAKIWIATAASWKELSERYLSAEALHDYTMQHKVHEVDKEKPEWEQ